MDEIRQALRAAGFGHDPQTALVREIMAKKAYCCFENQSLDEAREIMCERHLDYLPVVDDDMRIMGIVALRDLESVWNGLRATRGSRPS